MCPNSANLSLISVQNSKNMHSNDENRDGMTLLRLKLSQVTGSRCAWCKGALCLLQKALKKFEKVPLSRHFRGKFTDNPLF